MTKMGKKLKCPRCGNTNIKRIHNEKCEKCVTLGDEIIKHDIK